MYFMWQPHGCSIYHIHMNIYIGVLFPVFRASFVNMWRDRSFNLTCKTTDADALSLTAIPLLLFSFDFANVQKRNILVSVQSIAPLTTRAD